MKTDYKMSFYNGKTIREHRLIWMQNFGEIPDGYDIHHKDLDKLNNNISNLECITKKEHSSRHPISNHNKEKMNQASKERWVKYRGDIPKGFLKCTMCKSIKENVHFHISNYKYSGHNIYCKDCQKIYAKQIKEKIGYKGVARGERQGNAKLKEADVIEIKSLYRKEKQQSLADRFGVALITIQRIHEGRTWNYVHIGP